MPHLEELVAVAAMETHAVSHGSHGNATDSSNAISDDDGDATIRGTRPGKRPHAEMADRPVRTPTYLVRKAEKETLADEIAALERRLEQLKMRAGLPTTQAEQTLERLRHANSEIEESIHRNLLGLARFQSLVAQHLHAVPIDPMATLIHLTRDPDERRATLRALRPMKLRRAKELVGDRLCGLRETQPYLTEERFVSRNGDYHCRRFDIHPFHGGFAGGARQLFDALVHYLSNREISMTERLGQLIIQEDKDCVDPTLWLHRVVSATGAGYVQDVNSAGFAQYDADSEQGVIAVDAVDVDDLYPYVPNERVRKDVTAALLVSQVPGASCGDPPVAVLKRCVSVTIHEPQFPLPPSVMDEVVANVASWSTAMARLLNDRTTTTKNTTTRSSST